MGTAMPLRYIVSYLKCEKFKLNSVYIWWFSKWYPANVRGRRRRWGPRVSLLLSFAILEVDQRKVQSVDVDQLEKCSLSTSTNGKLQPVDVMVNTYPGCINAERH